MSQTSLVLKGAQAGLRIVLLRSNHFLGHKRALSILEPHLRETIRIESENSLLKTENKRLRDQLAGGPRASEPIRQIEYRERSMRDWVR